LLGVVVGVVVVGVVVVVVVLVVVMLLVVHSHIGCLCLLIMTAHLHCGICKHYSL
jgi:hypothetical protein